MTYFLEEPFWLNFVSFQTAEWVINTHFKCVSCSEIVVLHWIGKWLVLDSVFNQVQILCLVSLDRVKFCYNCL